MRGIESAFWGVVGSETIELKTARSGKPWAAFNVGATVGTDEDGKDVLQWLRVSTFGETAERVASTFRKGDRCYCEGSLRLEHWEGRDGEAKHGLSLMAFKAEKVGVSALGRNKPKQAPPGAQAEQAPHHRAPQRERIREYVPPFSDPVPF
jgi:single-stranded DNA-binding protein